MRAADSPIRVRKPCKLKRPTRSFRRRRVRRVCRTVGYIVAGLPTGRLRCGCDAARPEISCDRMSGCRRGALTPRRRRTRDPRLRHNRCPLYRCSSSLSFSFVSRGRFKREKDKEKEERERASTRGEGTPPTPPVSQPPAAAHEEGGGQGRRQREGEGEGVAVPTGEGVHVLVVHAEPA
jgi:hypothetical protein